jgi:hypothetical protein
MEVFKNIRTIVNKIVVFLQSIFISVFLFFIYFIILGLTKFIFLVFDKNKITPKIDANKSNWNDINIKEYNIEDYYYQS